MPSWLWTGYRQHRYMTPFNRVYNKGYRLHRLPGALIVLAIITLLLSCQGNRGEKSASAKDTVQNATATPLSNGKGAIASAPAFTGDTLSLHVKTVQIPGTGVDTLWGYEVYTGDKLYIRQYNVPGIAGKNGFTSAGDAGKVGEMVSHKLKTGQIPSISQKELSQLKVQYKGY